MDSFFAPKVGAFCATSLLKKYSLDCIFLLWHIVGVEWEVEYTDEFGQWWETLREMEQASISAGVSLLENYGPSLPFPYSSGINGSKHSNIRELRIQHEGRPFRILYAFDPRRCAILLLGGDKTGDDRWYDKNVPIADRLFDEHLETLQEEGLIDGKKIQ